MFTSKCYHNVDVVQNKPKTEISWTQKLKATPQKAPQRSLTQEEKKWFMRLAKANGQANKQVLPGQIQDDFN